MGIRDRMYLLTNAAEVDEFLQRFPTSAIFKAGACHKTSQVFAAVEKVLHPRDSISIAFMRAIEEQAASEYTEQVSGIAHEAPQFILFKDGKPVYDVDHWNMTEAALSVAASRHLGPLPGESASPILPIKDASRYATILKQFLSGSIGEEELQQRWSEQAPSDAHLKQLLVDMDCAVSGTGCGAGGCGCSSLPMASRYSANLRLKAGQLLAILRAYTGWAS